MLVTVMDKHDMLTGATHDNTMEVKLDYTHLFLVLNMSLQPLVSGLVYTVPFPSVTAFTDNTHYHTRLICKTLIYYTNT